ncbi:MAG: M23 family metallopeptidase [Treponema sp.]|jgi:murein DD-endopeptidase MepM/ murein hydrolase activator NlpD|nr:M23 family metallopeptidase [Treponema sp.]
MGNILLKQRVTRRKRSLLQKAAAYRLSQKIDDPRLFLSQIRQKPVSHHKKSVKKRSPRLLRLPHASRFQFVSFLKNPGKIPENKVFSIPVSSFAIIMAVSGILVFSIFSFNRDDVFFRFPGSSVLDLELPEDPHHEASLASFAGIDTADGAEGETDIPLDLIETFSWSNYKVRRGDSVSRIAAKYSLSMDAIIAGNSIRNARRLREGENLRIPNMDGIPYTIRKGDTLEKVSKNMGVPLEAILDANDIQNDTIAAGTQLFIPGAKMKKEDLHLAMGDAFIYPVRGRLTSGYGWRNDPISGVRRYHAALDLAVPEGTTVKASMDGRISTVGYNPTYGRYIIVSHGSGFQTMYAHLSNVLVKQNAWVLQGAKIGESGNTGYSTGPHLHFAMYKNGRAVNPLDYLN